MVNPLVAWCRERENIRLKKEAGEPLPWTQDEVLSKFRFCNVRREDDKVTRWISTNWRTPNAEDPDVWFAMAVARHLNLPETLGQLGYPVPWNAKRFVEVVRSRKESGMVAYNGAYMIRASSGSQFKDKAEYLAKMVLGPLWKHREKLRPVEGDTLEAFHQRLLGEYGIGSFLGGQIVSDVCYVGALREAHDWWDFAASGPGSRRGLNFLLGRSMNQPWKEQDWRIELAKLRLQIKPEFEEVGLEWCHARDTQNQCCEYSKMRKLQLGLGRPKQRYVARLELLG